MQVLQLLVELLAQAGELVGVAEVFGGDFLVVLPRVGTIGGAVIGIRAFAPRLRATGAVVTLRDGGLVFQLLAGVVGCVAFHLLRLGTEGTLLLGFRLAFALFRIVLFAGLFAALFAVLLLVIGFRIGLGFGELHRGKQLARGAGEGALVVLGAAEFAERVLDIGSQPVAPEVQHAAGGFRRRLAGHAFAGEQGERGGDRHLLFPRHAVVAFGLAFLRELGVQVGSDTGHVAGADGFHPRLFQRVVHVAGFAPVRHARVVHGVVVMAQAERDRVRRAAQLGHLGRRQGARGQRQARALAGDARRAGLEIDLHIRDFGDRTQHAGGGALEVLGAGVVLGGAAHGGELIPSSA